ncbi:hypothetical protein DXC78_03975 [Faecalicoccus pleomorphus]|uniref:Uncharacterized protein n=1 Tax=Faecalicoccus pleomorphus TaxID=1323 RepID=A0A3E3E5P3_9FIRM|nr:MULTISPECIES: hypothetical protein [Faecalicoccus]MDB7989888.1 hypothetical protein [Faecalicoccus pleomorphus]MDB7994135.1 hypothetical protein [Faecalicoccus pleomorphus]MDY5110088.1 hypothetical protein [Faecalicoccus sp.]RGD77092.1 hypothetical protein DXC78_03975 [Faecalicoccus pleomorphus]
MKACKGCVNRECKSFKHKTHYKDEYEYCPICGEKLEYVCADCWKVMDHSTEKYCVSCAAKREQKKENIKENIKDWGTLAVSAASAVGGLAVKNKDKIAAAGKAAMKIIKK